MTRQKLSETDRKNAQDDLNRLDGKPPYDDPGNPCRGDGYFALSIEKKWGMSISQVRRLVARQRL